MPRPLAIPFTNCVLPAPNSPIRPMTIPGLAVAAISAPRDRVSSGFLEMCVAMEAERACSIFVAEAKTRLGRNSADTGELELRELGFPRVMQANGIARGKSKE